MRNFKLILTVILFVAGLIGVQAQNQGATSKKGSVSAPAKLPSQPQSKEPKKPTRPVPSPSGYSKMPTAPQSQYGQAPPARNQYTAPPARNTGYSKMPEAPANRQLNRQNAVRGGLNNTTGGYQSLPKNSQTAGARQGQYQSLPNNASTANARQGQYQKLVKIPAPINGNNSGQGQYQSLPNNSQTAGARQGQYQSLPNNASTAGARQGQYQSLPNNASTANAKQGQYQKLVKIPAPINDNRGQRPLNRQNAVRGGLNNNTGGYQSLPSTPETNGAKKGHYQTLPKLPPSAPNNTISKPVVPGQTVQYQNVPTNQYDRVSQPPNSSSGSLPRNQYDRPSSPLGSGGKTNKLPVKPVYDKVPREKGKQLNRTKAVKSGLSDKVKKSGATKGKKSNKRASSARGNPNKKGKGKKINPNKKGSKSAPAKLPKRKGRG